MTLARSRDRFKQQKSTEHKESQLDHRVTLDKILHLSEPQFFFFFILSFPKTCIKSFYSGYWSQRREKRGDPCEFLQLCVSVTGEWGTLVLATSGLLVCCPGQFGAWTLASLKVSRTGRQAMFPVPPAGISPWETCSC